MSEPEGRFCFYDFFACSEAAQASRNKYMLLSFERYPKLESRQGGRGRLSKEKSVVRPEI